jgi:hypothetical protein
MIRIKIFLLLLSVSMTGCINKHIFTTQVCNGLYVETFNINPAGVNEDYLTDSVTFKISIDTWDDEHETISYFCHNDSLYIIKTERGSKNCHWIKLNNGTTTLQCDIDTLSMRYYNVTQLNRKHIFEK